MRIIDTFPFSEPYETEILLLKLRMEESIVDEWIIVENSFTFQGEFKGLYAKKIIAEDSRFSRFRDRIKVISSDIPTQYLKSDSEVNDEEAFKAEYQQRNLSREYILNKYRGQDVYVLLSDTDEILDVNSDKKSYFKRKCAIAKYRGYTRLVRKRYWYDFNNMWPERRTTPLFHINFLDSHSSGFGPLRRNNVINPLWGKPLVCEFSYCFPKEFIIRKYETFSHTGYNRESIFSALKYNHIAVREGTDVFKVGSSFLSVVPVEKKFLPEIVVDEFDVLTTNAIDRNYMAHRFKKFGNRYPKEHLSLRKFFSRLRDNLK